MTPRNFLNFFRTRSGRLTLFGLLFTGALLILSALRKQGGDDAGMVTKPATNRADAPQVVQTVQREMEIFRPPPPKPEPPRPPARKATRLPPFRRARLNRPSVCLPTARRIFPSRRKSAAFTRPSAD